MTTLPVPQLLAAAVPFALWALALISAIAAVCCMIATGLLGLAFLLLAIPQHDAPPVFRVLIGVVALVLSVVGGGPAAQLALALATRSTSVPGVHGGIVVHDRVSGLDETREVLRGGTTIGYLERFATTGSIMAGFPEALGVLIAIKGVGRFTELEAPEARERFIIGTLVSLIWACVCAGLFRFAVA